MVINPLVSDFSMGNRPTGLMEYHFSKNYDENNNKQEHM